MKASEEGEGKSERGEEGKKGGREELRKGELGEGVIQVTRICFKFSFSC